MNEPVSKVARIAIHGAMLASCIVGQIGCGSTKVAQEPTTVPSGVVREAHNAPAVQTQVTASEDGVCSYEPVYFSYDSDSLESAASAALGRNAACVRQRHATTVRLTGMTDPRGTEEYNLALGQRRAEVSARYLIALGVEKEKIEPVSAGEELASGGDESSWASDRRAELSEK